jgi:hypothetical protein
MIVVFFVAIFKVPKNNLIMMLRSIMNISSATEKKCLETDNLFMLIWMRFMHR